MSKGNEAKLWTYVEKRLKSISIHLTRVESHSTAVGVPDVNYCIEGIEGWIELKAETTKGMVLRQSQKVWMRDRLRAGATKIYLLWAADVEYTDKRGLTRVYGLIHCNPSNIRTLFNSTKPVVWFAESFMTWENSIDFEQLKRELKR